ncbi:GntR family transcriptional regulator [Pectinatus haikarae]|uniref:DNA-binding GntR family transcriptional regulator n=1 Tax=Pectinatus haikarae TaxID=349096 RepID=A0ABT9Y800_9FIRM|nr:GntR family transcriptional regulator [Pectinatus haikarae]MDQ0203942.1 DNA-binding GntR family transcriptional regulator [Pectinatus haikarae]
MIKKVSYKDQVYQYLKQAIVKGEINPGEIYSEQMFADQLEVSRTPVREAVLQLKHEGLVEIYNNRGISVKPISIDDINQILQARTAIEGYSVKYLTERITSAEGQKSLKQLLACLNETESLLEESTGHYKYMKADIEFHGIIVHFTKNMYFIKTVDQMRTRLEQVTVNSLTFKNRHRDALSEHKKIFEGICSGNAEKAENIFIEHMLITGNILKKMF